MALADKAPDFWEAAPSPPPPPPAFSQIADVLGPMAPLASACSSR